MRNCSCEYLKFDILIVWNQSWQEVRVALNIYAYKY